MTGHPTVPEWANPGILSAMNPEEKERFFRELSNITKNIVKNEEQHKFIFRRFNEFDEKIKQLESKNVSNHQQEFLTIQQELDRRRAESNRWKWWLLGILAALITTSLIAAFTYLAAR